MTTSDKRREKKHKHKFKTASSVNGFAIPDTNVIKNRAGEIIDIVVRVCKCGKLELYSQKLLIEKSL